MKIHIHNNLILISANIKIEIPEIYDIIKIIFIMCVFSILQALFTYYGLKYL